MEAEAYKIISVTLGAVSLLFTILFYFFRSEFKHFINWKEEFAGTLIARCDRMDSRIGHAIEEMKNLHQVQLNWTQREFEKMRNKCEEVREQKRLWIKEVKDEADTDAKEIIRLTGEMKLIEEKLGIVQQFFYDGKALWESKAEMLERIEMLEEEIKRLKVE